MAEQDLIDPVTRYPKPPFKKQSQPWPGLAGKMEPRPDHGETSYKGSGRLAGRKALITGGDSGMGRAAAIAYAREGADVAINYLPAEEPDAQEVIALIKEEGRNGVAIPGDLTDEAFCKKLVEQAVQGLGGLDIVVNNAAPAADPRVDPRHLDRGFRRDDEDQHLRAVLDHQGGAAASEAGLVHHRHDVRAGLRSLARSLRLRADQGGDDELREVAGEAARRRRASASTASRRDRSGRRCRSRGGATMEKLEKFGGMTPLGRPGQPAELASIYVQLAAADASYATGQVYGSAGGSGQP